MQGFRCGSLFGAVVVSTGARWCRVQGFRWSFVVCSVPLSLPFVPLPALFSVHRLEICLYFAFLGGLARFQSVGVGLYCLRALRGLWGFCVREWLGGLEACSVFASVFLLLCLYFVRFYLLCLSSGALPLLLSACPLCLLCLSLWPCGLCCCFLFPFGIYAKRKGAKCFCVLSCPVVGLFISP